MTWGGVRTLLGDHVVRFHVNECNIDASIEGPTGAWSGVSGHGVEEIVKEIG